LEAQPNINARPIHHNQTQNPQKEKEGIVGSLALHGESARFKNARAK
jgi:hypothetical protein